VADSMPRGLARRQWQLSPAWADDGHWGRAAPGVTLWVSSSSPLPCPWPAFTTWRSTTAAPPAAHRLKWHDRAW